MAVFDETLFRVVPEIYRSLDRALQAGRAGRRSAPAFLRFGSWVGGDRDGNAVTAAVTRAAMDVQAEHVLLAFETAATRIGRALTLDAATTPPIAGTAPRGGRGSTPPIRSCIAEIDESARRTSRTGSTCCTSRSAIRATRRRADLGYADPDDLLDDLRVVQELAAPAGPSPRPTASCST